MSHRDDVNTPLVVLVGFLGTILTFAIIVALMVVYYHAEKSQEYEKVISQPWAEVADLVARQQAKLAEYRWIDQNKGIVAIPVELAMQLVVKNPSQPASLGPAEEPAAKQSQPTDDSQAKNSE